MRFEDLLIKRATELDALGRYAEADAIDQKLRQVTAQSYNPNSYNDPSVNPNASGMKYLPNGSPDFSSAPQPAPQPVDSLTMNGDQVTGTGMFAQYDTPQANTNPFSGVNRVPNPVQQSQSEINELRKWVYNWAVQVYRANKNQLPTLEQFKTALAPAKDQSGQPLSAKLINDAINYAVQNNLVTNTGAPAQDGQPSNISTSIFYHVEQWAKGFQQREQFPPTASDLLKHLQKSMPNAAQTDITSAIQRSITQGLITQA